jgi:hypothetical protein
LRYLQNAIELLLGGSGKHQLVLLLREKITKRRKRERKKKRQTPV